MSSVRRLMQKSNSAPPTRIHLPNHGTTEEQLASIEAHRERTQLLEEKLNRFTSKVKQQKVESKQERHKHQWIQERGTLFQEREAAQQAVDSAMSELGALFAPPHQPPHPPSKQSGSSHNIAQDAPLQVAMKALAMECTNDHTSTVDLSRTLLTSIMNLRAQISSHALSVKKLQQQQSSSSSSTSIAVQERKATTKREQELHERLQHMKAYVQEETAVLVGCDGMSDRCTNDGMGKMLKELYPKDAEQLTGDETATTATTTTTTLMPCSVDDVEAQGEAALDAVRLSFGRCSDEAVGVFRAAMQALMDASREKERELHRNAFAETADATTKVSDDDEARIRMLIRAYDPARNRSMFGKTREELFDRIVHDMPHLTLPIAQGAVHRIEDAKAQKRDHRTLILQTQASSQQLIRSFEAVARAEEAAMVDAEERLAQQHEEQLKRDAYKQTVAQLRAEHDERQMARDAVERAVRDAQQAQEDARHAALHAEYEQRLQELARYHQERAEAEESQRAANAALQKAKDDEKLRRAAADSARVDVRRQAYKDHMDELGLQKLLADEEAQRKQESYNRFFASVEAALGVSRDPRRVMQGTVASEQQPGAGYIGAREAAAGTTARVSGYTTERLLKDPRFKIHQALVAANLHHTAYARQVLTGPQFAHVGAAMRPSANNPLAAKQ